MGFFNFRYSIFQFDLFLCFATRPSHCPTVGFFFRGWIVLRWRAFCPTQGKHWAYRPIQHSSIFNRQCFLNLKADQPLLRERISNHAVRPMPIPFGIFINHSHEGHALNLTTAELIQLSHPMCSCICGTAYLHSNHSASTADSEIDRLLLDCNTLEQEILTRMVKELKAILYGLGV